jgi:hypothetical protein
MPFSKRGHGLVSFLALLALLLNTFTSLPMAQAHGRAPLAQAQLEEIASALGETPDALLHELCADNEPSGSNSNHHDGDHGPCADCCLACHLALAPPLLPSGVSFDTKRPETGFNLAILGRNLRCHDAWNSRAPPFHHPSYL